ncbi:MAG: type 2 periplasmic-binding domain-containing protein [Candidatus Methanospirareceae archaeon]
MLYLIADSDGGVSEVIVAKDFSEAYRKIEENNGELVIELNEETLDEIEKKRNRSLKIVKFVWRGEVVWQTEFFSNLNEDELQEAVDEAIEELDEQMETWTGEDLIRLMKKRGQIRTPSFSVDRCKIEI